MSSQVYKHKNKTLDDVLADVSARWWQGRGRECPADEVLTEEILGEWYLDPEKSRRESAEVKAAIGETVARVSVVMGGRQWELTNILKVTIDNRGNQGASIGYGSFGVSDGDEADQYLSWAEIHDRWLAMEPGKQPEHPIIPLAIALLDINGIVQKAIPNKVNELEAGQDVAADRVREARERFERVKARKETEEDKKALSNVPQSCKTLFEGASHELNKAIKAQKETRQERRERQLDMFDQGLMYPTGKDTAMAANSILRGNLFSPVMRGARKYVSDFPVLEWGDDVEMSYSGARLDQADFDVLLALGRLIQGNPEKTDTVIEMSGLEHQNLVTNNPKFPGGALELVRAKFDNRSLSSGTGFTRVKCTARGLLKNLNRGGGGSSIKWLQQALNRLGGKIVYRKRNNRGRWLTLSTAMVGNWGYDEQSGLLAVDINHDFIRLLKLDGQTIIEWDKRLSLTPFGKWLYGYICTHKRGKPQYQTTDQLMQSSGMKYGRARAFVTSQVRPALVALKNRDVIQSFSITGHKVMWIRSLK